MEKVVTKKADLYAAVLENRTRHEKIFKEAIEGYRKKALAELTRLMDELKDGNTNVDLFIKLSRPVNHTKDYNRVLKMIEMHQEDTVVIDQQAFAQYVMDDWSWKKDFLSVSNTYLASPVSD